MTVEVVRRPTRRPTPHRRRAWTVVVLLAGLSAVDGCGGRGLLPACPPGKVESCACGDARTGRQICTQASAWGACICDADDGRDARAERSDPAGEDAGGLDVAADAVVDAALDVAADVSVDASPDAASDGPASMYPVDGGPRDAGADVCATCPVLPSLSIAAQHLLLDPTHTVLFATVGGAAAMYPNSLVLIDPRTRQVTSSLSLGSQPSTMAISDDGTTLWVGLDGSSKVQRVDVTTRPPTAGASFTLPKSSSGFATNAGPMFVPPGTTSSVAVSMRTSNSPSFAGLAIFDDGIARPQMVTIFSGPSRMVRGPAGWAFGFNSDTTAFGFYALAIGATGVTHTEFGGLVTGFQSDLVYAEGRIYATSGEVLDVSNPASPARAGLFTYKGLVAPLPGKPRAFMLTPRDFTSTSKVVLRVLDTTRFVQVTSNEVPNLTEEALWDLQRVDDGLLVVATGPRSLGAAAGRVIFLPVDAGI